MTRSPTATDPMMDLPTLKGVNMLLRAMMFFGRRMAKVTTNLLYLWQNRNDGNGHANNHIK